MESIKLKKSTGIITIKLEDENGNDTGETLVFDIEDVNTALNYQESIELHKKNLNYLKQTLIIIDKKEDHKGKKILSSNEEEKLKAMKKFYEDDMKALDIFIGEGKTQTILNIMGRNPYYSMYDDIFELLKQVTPLLENGYKDFEKRVKEKYTLKKEENVLE